MQGPVGFKGNMTITKVQGKTNTQGGQSAVKGRRGLGIGEGRDGVSERCWESQGKDRLSSILTHLQGHEVPEVGMVIFTMEGTIRINHFFPFSRFLLCVSLTLTLTDPTPCF